MGCSAHERWSAYERVHARNANADARILLRMATCRAQPLPADRWGARGDHAVLPRWGILALDSQHRPHRRHYDARTQCAFGLRGTGLAGHLVLHGGWRIYGGAARRRPAAVQGRSHRTWPAIPN